MAQALVSSPPVDAFSRLDPVHRAYVGDLLTRSRKSMSEAWAAANPGKKWPNENALAQAAHRAAHRKDVQEVLKEEAAKSLVTMLPTIVGALESVLKDPQHKDFAKTAMMVLRETAVGQGNVVHHEHSGFVGFDPTSPEMAQKLIQFAKGWGLDVNAFRGYLIEKVGSKVAPVALTPAQEALTIDAEYVEHPPGWIDF